MRNTGLNIKPPKARPPLFLISTSTLISSAFLGFLFSVLFSLTVYANETESISNDLPHTDKLEKKWRVKAGLLLGVLGGGAEIGLPIGLNKVIRVKWQQGQTRERQTNSGIDFNEEFQAEQTGLYLDWHPWNTGFRGTFGLSSNKNWLRGVTANSNQLTIGNNSYTQTELDSLEYEATYGKIATYIGFGWSLVPTKNSTWFITLDTGLFIQGQPKIKFEAIEGNLGVDSQILQENINLEREQISDNIEHLTLLPTYTVGISRSF